MFYELLKWLALPFTLPRVVVMLVWALFVADLSAGQYVLVNATNHALRIDRFPDVSETRVQVPAQSVMHVSWPSFAGQGWYQLRAFRLDQNGSYQEIANESHQSTDGTVFYSVHQPTDSSGTPLVTFYHDFMRVDDLVHSTPSSPPGITVGGYTVHDLTLGVIIACAILACIVVGWRHGYSR